MLEPQRAGEQEVLLAHPGDRQSQRGEAGGHVVGERAAVVRDRGVDPDADAGRRRGGAPRTDALDHLRGERVRGERDDVRQR
ncbi:hypothetical protein GCM10027446_18830 [Angustibacter peucedani]